MERGARSRGPRLNSAPVARDWRSDVGASCVRPRGRIRFGVSVHGGTRSCAALRGRARRKRRRRVASRGGRRRRFGSTFGRERMHARKRAYVDGERYVEIPTGISPSRLRDLVGAIESIEPTAQVTSVGFTAVADGTRWSEERFGYRVTYSEASSPELVAQFVDADTNVRRRGMPLVTSGRTGRFAGRDRREGRLSQCE